MTSLPILWGEGDIADMLAQNGDTGWVREALSSRYTLAPLDRLTALDGQTRLALMQPRALAGDENVALDNWVRAGGQVLLMADPMLTAESRYPIGDARAPVPVALLSPILARWGLRIAFDPAQSPETRMLGDPALPVRMPGQLESTGEGFESECEIGEDALIARCNIGAGHALIVADAALVEQQGDASDSQENALAALLDGAFGPAK